MLSDTWSPGKSTRMDNNVIQLKQQLSLRVYQDTISGIEPGNKHYPCPLPGLNQVGRDTKPDFRIEGYNGEYRWICTCGNGDCIDFRAKMKGITNGEAIQFIKDKFGNSSFSSEEQKLPLEKKAITPEKLQQIYSDSTDNHLRILKYFNEER